LQKNGAQLGLENTFATPQWVITINFVVLHQTVLSFNALTLLIGRQKEQIPLKNNPTPAVPESSSLGDLA